MKFLKKAEDFVGIVTIYFIIFLLALQVFCRYILSQPLGWAEELAQFIFVWSIFIGAVITTREREHVRVEFIKIFISKQNWGIINIFCNILILIFLVFIFPSALGYALYAFNIYAPGSGMSMFFIYVSVPLCGLIMAVHTIDNIYKDIKELITMRASVGKYIIKEVK